MTTRRRKPMTSLDLIIMGFVAALILSLGFPAIARFVGSEKPQPVHSVE